MPKIILNYAHPPPIVKAAMRIKSPEWGQGKLILVVFAILIGLYILYLLVMVFIVGIDA